MIAKEYPEAVVGFAVNQWCQLDRDEPSAIIPMPDRESVLYAKLFASYLKIPLERSLRRRWGQYEYEGEGEPVLFDAMNSVEELQKALKAFGESSPKRVFVLSLFHVYPHH
jgi:hypothetical protein